MKILGFAASNSENSINKKLIKYVINKIGNDNNNTKEILDINDYEMPIYSIDKEIKNGINNKAINFYEKIKESDLIIISFAEYNGTYTSAYKNIFDWVSRINPKVFENKKLIYFSTSPGEYGAMNVLMQAVNSVTYFGGELIGYKNLPLFYDNFDIEKNKLMNEEFNDYLENLSNKLL